MYAMIAKIIYGLVTAFEWIEECETSFEKLKQAFIVDPILKMLDYSKIFHVHVDASAYVVGCILAQPKDKNMDCYVSQNWMRCKKEFFHNTMRGIGNDLCSKKVSTLFARKQIYVIHRSSSTYVLGE